MTSMGSMLAELQDAGVLFDDDDIEPPAPPAVALMNCNDLFEWACADAEPVTAEELPALHAAWMADRSDGPLLWACRKRQQRPQEKLELRMRARGEWTTAFDALPPRKVP